MSYKTSACVHIQQTRPMKLYEAVKIKLSSIAGWNKNNNNESPWKKLNKKKL